MFPVVLNLLWVFVCYLFCGVLFYVVWVCVEFDFKGWLVRWVELFNWLVLNLRLFWLYFKVCLILCSLTWWWWYWWFTVLSFCWLFWFWFLWVIDAFVCLVCLCLFLVCWLTVVMFLIVMPLVFWLYFVIWALFWIYFCIGLTAVWCWFWLWWWVVLFNWFWVYICFVLVWFDLFTGYCCFDVLIYVLRGEMAVRMCCYYLFVLLFVMISYLWNTVCYWIFD